MDLDSVPDITYDIKEVNGGFYRMPAIPKRSFEESMSSWKPKNPVTRGTKEVDDDDEPHTQICGVENPFAGIAMLDEELT